MPLRRAFQACLLFGVAVVRALELPDIPDPQGRAGMMAAVVRDSEDREAILAAGGPDTIR